MISSAQEFVDLRCSDDPEEYRRAAFDEATEETWRQVIEQYPEMRRWVAHNKTIPEGVIRQLYAIGDYDILIALAMKRRTPSDVLHDMAVKGHDSVRMAIARHPHVLKLTLELLKKDPWEEVRNVAMMRGSE